jgi:hypothetical protein
MEMSQNINSEKRKGNWAALQGKLGTAKIRKNFMNAIFKGQNLDDEIIGIGIGQNGLLESGVGVGVGKRKSVIFEGGGGIERRSCGRSRISGKRESVKNFRNFFRGLEEGKTSEKVRSILGLGMGFGGERKQVETSYSTILRN